MKIKDLQDRYGLKTRQSIYQWVNALDIQLAKDDKGHSYATPEQLELLDQLADHLKNQGATLANFTPVSSVSPVGVNQPIDTLELTTVNHSLDSVNHSSDTAMEMMERLVGAIAFNLQPRSVINSHEQLEKCAVNGWILSTNEVQELIGVKPKGGVYQRGCWEFVRRGKIGSAAAWRVNKLNF